MMRVNIISSNKEQHIRGLELSEDTLVDSLRSILAHRFGVADDPAVVRLLFSGCALQNGRTLGSYAVRDGSTVHVVARAGAAPPASATSENATGSGGTDASVNFGGFDMDRLGRAIPRLASAAQQYFSGATDAAATAGNATLASAEVLLSAVMNARTQAQSSATANASAGATAEAPPASTSGQGATNVAAELLSNPAVSGFLSNLFTATTAAQPSVNLHQDGIGTRFTAPPVSSAAPVAPCRAPPSFLYTPPTPSVGTVPLSGAFLAEHLMRETQHSGVDTAAVAMGFLMGNALSLQPLRQPFAAAWLAYKREQSGVTEFGSSWACANRRTISLAGCEGERAYAAVLSQPETHSFLRTKAGVTSTTALEVLHCELRNFLKSVCLRLMRLIATPASDLTDAQWANALRAFLVFHVGLFLDRAPRWFPEGKADAAIQFLVDTAVAELQKRKPNNWLTMAAMVPSLVPQLVRGWHTEYLNNQRDSGREDYECFWNYPTITDKSVFDADERPTATAPSMTPDTDDEEAFADALAEELMAETALQPTESISAGAALWRAVDEWTAAANLPGTVGEELRAALREPSTASAEERAVEGSASKSLPTSSLWTEMLWSRRGAGGAGDHKW